MTQKNIDSHNDSRCSVGEDEGGVRSAIERMIKSNDYEVVLMGEHIAYHSEYYINELQRIGFPRDEAEAGIAFYCESQVLVAEMGGDVHLPDYREDIVQELAEFSRRWKIAG